MTYKISNEEIIKQLQNLPKDKIISSKLLEEYHRQGLICSISHIFINIGNIEAICKIIGIDNNKIKQEIEDNRKINKKNKIIEQLQNLPKDKTITIELIKKYHKQGLICSTSHIIKYVGGLKNICEIVGVKYENYEYKHEKIKNRIINILSQLPKNIKYDSASLKKLCKSKILPFSYSTISHNFSDIKKVCILSGLEYDVNCHKKLKGINYEDLYGIEKASYLKKLKSDLRKGKFFGSIETRNKARKRLLGKSFIEIYKDKSEDVLNKFNSGDRPTGTYEKQFLDEIEQYISHKIIRNLGIILNSGHLIHIDGYIKEKSLVIEIDENYHKNKKVIEKDRIRDIETKKILLNCIIIRIPTDMWLNNTFYKNNTLNIINSICNKGVECQWQ